MGHFYKNDYKSNMDNDLLRKTILAAMAMLANIANIYYRITHQHATIMNQSPACKPGLEAHKVNVSCLINFIGWFHISQMYDVGGIRLSMRN